MSSGRKKPLTLDWQGGLLGAQPPDAKAVTVKGASQSGAGKSNSSLSQSAAESHAAPWRGKLRARREVKGRGGHPAFVLYEFVPAASGVQVRELASALRAALGCGGSASDDGEIILNAPNWERLKQALDKRGIAAITSGGF